MITLKDCLDYSHLSETEINAIAVHDHEPTILSVAHGECLITSETGKEIIKQYILDNISYAQVVGNPYHVQALKVIYENFDKSHQRPR